jgi:hypothetical protein
MTFHAYVDESKVRGGEWRRRAAPLTTAVVEV